MKRKENQGRGRVYLHLFPSPNKRKRRQRADWVKEIEGDARWLFIFLLKKSVKDKKDK